MRLAELPCVVDLGISGPALIMLGGVFAAALAEKGTTVGDSAEEGVRVG